MKLLATSCPPSPERRRGAVLLLAFLVLMVIIAITYQLSRVTATDQRVAIKELTSTKMDLAIESALLEILDQLRQDGELRLGADQGAGGAGGGEGMVPPEGGEGGPPGGGGGAGGGEQNPDAVDSQMDDWAQQASTTINELSLRILVVDEDRKYNVLNMLSEDEDEAEAAMERVTRVLDLCREDTEADIDGSDAAEMARVMRDHLIDRSNSTLPRPARLLSDDEENEERALPLTMREFIALEPFNEDHFRDFFDEDGTRVHSIEAYLTIWTAPYTEGDPEGGGDGVTAEGGYAVNVNTAPLTVLVSLVDPRDLDPRIWDQVLEYRNLEEELPEGEEQDEQEMLLDEFGNEIIRRRIFDSLEELSELPDWDGLEPEARTTAESLLTVTSDVFSIYITARLVTGDERNEVLDFTSRLEQEEYERSGAHLVRTVRAVYWRQLGEDEVRMVPLVRWEVLDHAPLPVLDYPDEERW